MKTLAPLALLLLAACSGSVDNSSQESAQEEDLSSAKTFSCKPKYADASYPKGFRLKKGTRTSLITDLDADQPIRPYTANLDPSYKPEPDGKYAGMIRFPFQGQLEGFFSEAWSIDLLVKPKMKSGDVAYLRDQGPEGGGSQPYVCR